MRAAVAAVVAVALGGCAWLRPPPIVVPCEIPDLPEALRVVPPPLPPIPADLPADPSTTERHR